MKYLNGWLIGSNYVSYGTGLKKSMIPIWIFEFTSTEETQIFSVSNVQTHYSWLTD